MYISRELSICFTFTQADGGMEKIVSGICDNGERQKYDREVPPGTQKQSIRLFSPAKYILKNY